MPPPLFYLKHNFREEQLFLFLNSLLTFYSKLNRHYCENTIMFVFEMLAKNVDKYQETEAIIPGLDVLLNGLSVNKKEEYYRERNLPNYLRTGRRWLLRRNTGF